MKSKTIRVRSLCIRIEENLTLRAHLICILFAMIIMGMTSLFAQPVNDDCSTAITIGCGDTLSGTTIDGLPDAVGVCGTSATAPGVFYTFIGTGEDITVSLCSANTNFDTKLGIFEGDCASLICVDGNDDNCGLVSEVTFTSVAGTVYFFYVHGFSSGTGNFDISVTCGGGGGGGNDECANALPISCGETIDGSTAGATVDAAPTCGTATITAPGVWYSFIGTGEQIEVSTCGTASYDTKISVFTDGCGLLTCVGSNDDGAGCPAFSSKLSFVSTLGVEYLILVHGYQVESGDFSLSVTCSTVVPAPPNDNCADVTPAIIINGTPVTFTGSTVGATASADEASLLGSATVWEAVTLTGTCNNLTVDYCGTTPFPGDAFIVYTDCPATTYTVGNFDLTTCPDGNVTINFYNLPAGTYYLPVLADAAFVTLGDYTMNVSSVDCPPPATNDLCSDASPVFCGDVVSGNTIGTTADGVVGCDGTASTAPGIWYSFTGTGEFITLSTCGTANFDTKLSVFSGGCGALSCVAENDDGAGCSGFTSTVGFASQAGVEYLILVHGFNAAASGFFDLSVSCVTPLPNEYCSNVTPTTITNGSSATFTGTTEGAVNDPADDAEFGYKVIWEAFTVTGACNNITISYCGSVSHTFNTFASLYLGCPPGSDFITDDDGFPDDTTCGDGNRVYTFSFAPAGTYYIPVFADPAALNLLGVLGSYTIEVSVSDCPPSTVANDSCVNAITVACGQVVQGTTIDAQPDGIGLSPCGTDIVSPGVWYVFAGTGDLVTVSTCNAASFDSKISVFSGACGSLTCVGGNDDGGGCSGFTSEFTFLSQAGTDYFILIHGFFETGDFDLSVTCAVPLPNDNCSDVVPVTLTNGTPVTFTGTTVGASASPEEASLFGEAVVWEAVTLTGTCNNLTVDYCGTAPVPGNFYIVIFADCPATLSTVIFGTFDETTCADGNGTLHFNNLPAGTYYLPVIADAGSATLGDYTMNVLSEDCPPAPANDDCSSVVPVTLTNGTAVTFTGTTVGATASADETLVLGAAAVWEAVILTGECNNLTVDFCGTTPFPGDGFIVYTDCPVTDFTVGVWDTTTCPDGNLTISFSNLPAGTYYLPVLADAGFITPGDYTMNVVSEDCPPPPANDDCSGAVPVTLTSGIPVTLTGSSVGGTASADETLVLGAAAVWEAVILTAPCNNLTVDYCGTVPVPDFVFVVYTDCPVTAFSAGIFNPTACADGNGGFTFTNLPAGTYYLPVLADAGFITPGDYTINVLATDYVVTGYTLVNSVTDQDIGPLLEGDIINLNNFPPFTIRTDVCHPVGSMQLALNGVFVRNENAVPYSLTGDAPTGNYRPWNPAPGAYQLTSTPYSGANASGTQVEVASNINFTIIDDDNCSLVVIDVLTDQYGAETSWELADLTDNTIVASAAAGTLDNLTSYHLVQCIPSSHCYEFRIFDEFADGMCCAYGIGSYKVTFAGNTVASGGEFDASEVTSFGNCSLDCADVVGGAVYSFTLVNAQSDLDLGPLNDGDTINLSQTGPISIRANVCSDDSVGSVKFFVNETLFKIENLVFYCIAGDNNGNYAAWNVQPGVYTVEAIPYSNDNGAGTEGTAYSVTITIINSSLKTDGSLVVTPGSDKVMVNAFPNPFKDNLTFEFSVPGDSPVSLELFSISGVKIATVFEGNVVGGELNQRTFTAGKLASGMYMYRLKTNDSVITERVTLAR